MEIKNPKTGHDLNMDSRLIDSHFKQNVLSQKDHKSFLDSLKDVSHKIKPQEEKPGDTETPEATEESA